MLKGTARAWRSPERNTESEDWNESYALNVSEASRLLHRALSSSWDCEILECMSNFPIDTGSSSQGFVGRELGEPGLKPTVRVGEAAMREVAAFLLDHHQFAGVPATALGASCSSNLRGWTSQDIFFPSHFYPALLLNILLSLPVQTHFYPVLCLHCQFI